MVDTGLYGRILADFGTLAQSEVSVFGSATHGFRLNPPISEGGDLEHGVHKDNGSSGQLGPALRQRQPVEAIGPRTPCEGRERAGVQGESVR
jgi:hypothetical protein